MYRETVISRYHCYDIARGKGCSAAKEHRRYGTLKKVREQVIKGLYTRVVLQRLPIKIDPSPLETYILCKILHQLWAKYEQSVTEY